MSAHEEHVVDPDLVELIESLFQSRDLGQAVDPGQFDEALWRDLEQAGLSRLTGEGEFGSGATWLESAELLRSAAYHGVALPIAENDLLAGWLAERAGLPDSDSLRATGVVDQDGAARDVAWARFAHSAVLLSSDGDAWRVQEFPLQADSVQKGSNLAGEPRDVLPVGRPDEAVTVGPDVYDEWLLRGALARSMQIAGALQRAVGIAVQYSLERTQFGRPIAGFQAVQQLAADIASETALVLAAADSAVQSVLDAGDWSEPQVIFDIAVAKSTASAAADVVSRGAHQILGAIGTTVEHPLHRLTLPALSWATEFGTASYWNARLVHLAASDRRDGTPWEFISRVR